MEPLLSLWSQWLIAAAVDMTAILAAVLVLETIAGSRVHPAVRHGVWLVILLRLALPPAALPSPVAVEVTPGWAGTLVAKAATPIGPQVFVVWLAGALSVAVGCLLRTWRSNRSLRPCAGRDSRARLRTAGIPDSVRVAIDARTQTPYVTGAWRPRLVLPTDWGEWPSALFAHAVGHELLHLRRRDLWIEAAWLTVAAFYWFHPLVHLARRRAHTARELCCDAQAAVQFGRGYRLSLLQLVAASAGVTSRPSTLVARHGWHPTIARLRALERWPGALSRRARVGIALLLAAAALLILPAHFGARARSAPDRAWLTDPTARQKAGLGSMHVRYGLMQLEQSEGSAK